MPSDTTLLSTTSPAALAPDNPDDPDKVIVGVPDIAKYLGETERSINHLISLGALPVFKLPGSIQWRLRPSRLREIYRQLEDEGMARNAERRAKAASAESGAEEAPAKPKPSKPRRRSGKR
jgi:hypothetical protein